MKFKYKAKKSLDEVIEGSVDADSLKLAVEQLGRQGITPIWLEPDAQEQSAKKQLRNLKVGRWSLKKLILFTQKLHNLTKSHVELLSALRVLQRASTDPGEKLLLDDVIKNIQEGATLSQCLSHYPQHFSLLYINIIRAGEGSGQLKDAFAQLLSYLQRLEDLKMKIAQALAYPIFMIFVGIGTIFVMLTFVLPRLISMFSDFQGTLPLPTQILMAISNTFSKYWPVMIIAAVFLFFLSRKNFGDKGNFLTYLKYHFPLARDLIYKQAIANFSTSLSLLLKSGVGLLTALGITAPIIGNVEYIAQLEEVRKAIKDGSTFSAALSKYKMFPDFFIQMLKVGEEGGRLDVVLSDIASSYEQEIESDLKIVSSLIEPAIILILGLIIGGMVMAVLLPIFNINTLVGG